MVVELASVRALAPFFGASTEVWTYAIGVVLAALASGYAAGGLAAEKPKFRRALGIALCLAGVGVCVSPLLLPRLAGAFLPADLSLADATLLLRAGALVSEAALFGLPVFFLGFAGPLFVRWLSESGATAGRASGLVLASSTVGGLFGTFGTTYVLIPEAGVRATLWGSGLLLGVVGIISIGLDRQAVLSGAGIALTGITAGLGWGSLRTPWKASSPGVEVLEEVASREQHLRVVRVGAGETWLQINESLDSFQSVDAPSRATPGHYYDVLAAAALWSEKLGPRVAVIGAGAGSVVRSLDALVPGSRVEAFELDPRITELGRRYFRLGELESKGARFFDGVDGRVALQLSTDPFDAILIDAYARQTEIPFHLVTREMFELCASRLNNGGILAINVSSFGREDPVRRSIARTLAGAPSWASSGKPLSLHVRGEHNSVVVARKSAALRTPADLLRTMRSSSKASLVQQLLQYIASPSGHLWEIEGNGALTLTDDRAPMELLQAASLEFASAGAR